MRLALTAYFFDEFHCSNITADECWYPVKCRCSLQRFRIESIQDAKIFPAYDDLNIKSRWRL
jgi:hypothetical protein